MSHKILIKTALKKQEAFKNITKHLETIKKSVRELDPKAQVFMFGSVAKKKYNYSSDIDILIITKLNPAIVHLELWKAGIKDPFEIHVHPPEKALLYKRWIKQIKV